VTDRIEIKGVEVLARHGVLEKEMTDAQVFLVDLTVYLDLAPAAGSDELVDTVDYGRLAEETHDLVQSESHRLIETVAERVAGRVLEEPAVERVVVTVHKPEAPIPVKVGDVAVTVDRSR
jgi:dihydroneopterin aldolase